MIQLRIETEIARRQAEEGMGRAMDRAEREIPKWGDLAYAWLERYCREHREFPGWFVTDSAELDPNFPAPSNPRAWGGVWRRAKKDGVVRITTRTLPHPKRHGCPAWVWESLIYAE